MRILIVLGLLLVTGLHEWVVKAEADSKARVFEAHAPGYETIKKILKSADTEIYIASSFAAYGDFSSPDFFAEYKKILQERHSQGVKALMVVPAFKFREQQMRAEFENRWQSYESWRDKKPLSDDIARKLFETPQQFQEKLMRYCGKTPLPASFDALLTLLLKHEQDFVAEAKATFAQAVIERGRVPFSMWSADGEHAAMYSSTSSRQFETESHRMVAFMQSAVDSAVGPETQQ